MSLWKVIPVLFCTGTMLLCGGELPKSFQFSKNRNSWRWHGVKFGLESRFSGWKEGRFTLRSETGTADGGHLFRFAVDYAGIFGEAQAEILPQGEDAFQIKLACPFPAQVKPGLRYLSVELPLNEAVGLRVRNGGKTEELRFPARFGKMELGLFTRSEGGEILLTDGRGIEFSGRGAVYAQDNRKFNVQSFSIRFWFNNDKLALTFRRHAPVLTPVPLEGAANRSFRDDYADDRKGGWTDQGSSNDLRMLPPGPLSGGGMRFRIADESSGAPGAIVVAGDKRGFAPAEAELLLPAGNNARSVLLLHASAWTPQKKVGELEVTYPDTAVETFDIIPGRDVGNWWGPNDLPNAKVAWRSNNPETPVGLYASAFALGGKNPIRVKFRIASPDAAWMIAAVTLADRPLVLPAHTPHPFTTAANRDWIQLDFRRKITPASPLDFSFLLTPFAPAGKFGWALPAPDGSLTFEKAPGKRFRAYGTNLCDTMIYLEKADADRLVEFLAAHGYNTVRFHHHDNRLRHPSDPDPAVLDPKILDQLDYLAARLIERGIYLTFDLYTSRKLRPGETLPILKKYPKLDLKSALELSPEGVENWKSFARAWMLHRNPYTGRTWAEEPAILFANLVNEDTATYSLFSNPDTVRCYTGLFAAYCDEKKIADRRVSFANKEFTRFVIERQQQATGEMMRFLRQELGVKFLLTSANYNGNALTTLLRDTYDAVDDHGYHNHPSFPERPWSHPYRFSQTSTIPAEAPLPVNLVRGRIWGKPFFVTEFNFCAPNLFRSESGPLIGAYSALQNCTGLYRFNFSGNRRRFLSDKEGIIVFESVNDPVMQLADRIAGIFFVRGDVSSAKQRYAWQLPADYWSKNRDSGYPDIRRLGLIAGIGALPAGKSLPGVEPYQTIRDAGVRKRLDMCRQTGVARSITDEIELDSRKGTFRVMTPRSESVTLAKGALKADRLAVSGADTFQTIAAIALDNRPLAESRSILILQLSNVCASGERYTDTDRRQQQNYGHAPLLLRRAKAKISLAVPGVFQIAAIDMQGDVAGTLPGKRQKDRFEFQADNGAFPGGIAGYHLTR